MFFGTASTSIEQDVAANEEVMWSRVTYRG